MIGRRFGKLLEATILLCGLGWQSNAFIPSCRAYRRLNDVAIKQLAALSTSHRKILDTRPFQDCWNANTWSVNPWNDTCVDRILQHLSGPAPQSLFVLNRAIQQENHTSLEDILSKFTFLAKPGFEFQVRGNEWRLEAVHNSTADDGWCSVTPGDDNRNAVELAHEALDIAIDASEKQCPTNRREIDALAQEAMERLSLTLGTDIRGRSSSDAAFAFCLAGITNDHLYQALALVARLELERIGQRPSFRSKHILQMVEKLAAAGIQDNAIYRIAAACLASKGEHLDVVKMLSHPNEFSLLSTRPVLWLWRFSARQRKVASLPERQQVNGLVENNEYVVSIGDWIRALDDPSLPLILDVGCGMGVSLLRLASMDQASQDSFNLSPEGALLGDINWKECNYVGIDLSQLCLGYARGIAQRWGLSGRLQFTHGPALGLLESVESQYPGNVELVMIQFPTPFKLKDNGNPQLPSDSESGFMVSKELLEVSKRILGRSHGRLMLQSNCEDVAVAMRDMAENSAGFDCVDTPSPFIALTGSHDESKRTPLRSSDWIQSGGKRAVGRGWSLTPLLPSLGTSETEVSCLLSKTPIHRCLLLPRTSS